MSKCRSCGAEVIWVRTVNNKNMPVDVNKVQHGNIILDDDASGYTVATVVKAGEGDYVSHFSTCGEAADWRKRDDD